MWLTDQAVPNREGLGLTSHTLKCDRLECQYVVEIKAGEAEPWMSSDVRTRLSSNVGFNDFEDGRQPQSWWIAKHAIFAERSRAYDVARVTP